MSLVVRGIGLVLVTVVVPFLRLLLVFSEAADALFSTAAPDEFP